MEREKRPMVVIFSALLLVFSWITSLGVLLLASDQLFHHSGAPQWVSFVNVLFVGGFLGSLILVPFLYTGAASYLLGIVSFALTLALPSAFLFLDKDVLFSSYNVLLTPLLSLFVILGACLLSSQASRNFLGGATRGH